MDWDLGWAFFFFKKKAQKEKKKKISASSSFFSSRQTASRRLTWRTSQRIQHGRPRGLARCGIHLGPIAILTKWTSEYKYSWRSYSSGREQHGTHTLVPHISNAKHETILIQTRRHFETTDHYNLSKHVHFAYTHSKQTLEHFTHILLYKIPFAFRLM